MAAYAAARGREGYACMGRAEDMGMTHGVCVVVTSVARKMDSREAYGDKE